MTTASRRISRRGGSRPGAVAGALVAALVLGGCGGASSNGEAAKAPSAILADAKGTSSAAGSVHVAGSLRQGTQQLALDVVAGAVGGGGVVTEDGATLQVVVRGPSIYLKGDRATWTKLTSPSIAAEVAGRWLRTSTTNRSFTSLASLFSVSSLVSSLSPSGTLTAAGTTTFAGHRAIALLDRGSAGGTIYVAAEGKPYILGLAGRSTEGRVTFDRYGSAPLPPVPAGATDISSLGAPAG